MKASKIKIVTRKKQLQKKLLACCFNCNVLTLVKDLRIYDRYQLQQLASRLRMTPNASTPHCAF